MSVSRRRFLRAAASVTAGLAGLRLADRDGRGAVLASTLPDDVGYGPLLDDPEGLLALPEGFRYTVISRAGETMDDGFLVPSAHDGMAAFPGPDGVTLLVRNHEVNWGDEPLEGPFGPANERLSRLDGGLVYDPGEGDAGPALGGTTTLLYDTRSGDLRGHRLSLVGTIRNCAGGPTPWGTWLTCEETVLRAGGGRAEDHGWVFEVPARWEGGPATPRPLTAMGRFNHEAVAVHPGSGVVYLTEDDGEGLLYRFIPERPGRLHRGGRLQALAFLDRPSMDTRNWGSGPTVVPGRPHPVGWIDVHDVEDPDGDLRHRGFADGAARFARGEGIWWGADAVYFACTNGGRARKGQVWRYAPSAHEGRPAEGGAPATLELFVEPDDGTLVENADNLCVAPWGDLVLCEDGTGDDWLVGVTPEGDLYKLAHDLNGTGEFAGACFSPDGSTLFVNKQKDGLTVAITGPWGRRPRG